MVFIAFRLRSVLHPRGDTCQREKNVRALFGSLFFSSLWDYGSLVLITSAKSHSFPATISSFFFFAGKLYGDLRAIFLSLLSFYFFFLLFSTSTLFCISQSFTFFYDIKNFLYTFILLLPRSHCCVLCLWWGEFPVLRVGFFFFMTAKNFVRFRGVFRVAVLCSRDFGGTD